MRDDLGQIVRTEYHQANFIFPKLEVYFKNEIRYERFCRVDNCKKSWTTLKQLAGVEDLQLKDFRTYFNFVLKNHYHFSSKEAGSYIGNSEEVNDLHYSPISPTLMQEKIKTTGSFNSILGMETPEYYV